MVSYVSVTSLQVCSLSFIETQQPSKIQWDYNYLIPCWIYKISYKKGQSLIFMVGSENLVEQKLNFYSSCVEGLWAFA